jgi:hypothetical protein
LLREKQKASLGELVDGHYTPILAINNAYISRENQHKIKRFGLLLMEFHLYMTFI